MANQSYANSGLENPISVQGSYIAPDILPQNFSETYRRIVLSGADDIKKVVNRANDAGYEAYSAQIKNEEQDVILGNHEERITKTEEGLASLEVRVLNIENDVNGLKIKIQDLDGKVSEILVDYVSLSRTTTQNLSSPLNVKTSYSVNGTKVIGQRVTGFTAATGAALKGGFNANQSFNVGTTYNQSEVQNLINGLFSARQR
ncbi:MAG: phage tail protein, partial [Arsenophonus sp.]|nr:phage tail protein [Arsenophonus sp.]